ncbi:MAG TPA: nuclear transport factor 2 family protein [Terriglobales bacterium]|nr:nuclear transport factor 2 family protein [Terriglobales bacterium]
MQRQIQSKAAARVRTTRWFAVAVLIAGSLWSNAQSGPERDASVKAEVIAREKASFDAWKRKDKAFYQDYWADDMTEFLPESRRLATKAEIMPKFEEVTRRWQLDDIQMHDPRVQVYGNVALLTYTESVWGRYDGKPSHYEGKVTMVYLHEGGEWKGVHYHESKINQ